jgi:hypothetical protein
MNIRFLRGLRALRGDPPEADFKKCREFTIGL